MRTLVLGIAMGLVVGISALAQEPDKYSADYMLRYCRAAVSNEALTRPADAAMEGMCVGIIDAIGFMMSEFPPQEKEKSSCPPSKVTLEQTVRAVITYIEARPERMHENFKTLVIEAIHDAWPCTTN
jgi:Rap1a immunity proteins